jgi:hypothetical protein
MVLGVRALALGMERALRLKEHIPNIWSIEIVIRSDVGLAADVLILFGHVTLQWVID